MYINTKGKFTSNVYIKKGPINLEDYNYRCTQR